MSFLWNTKNTDRIGVNEQNRHTTHKEKDNFRKGKLMLVIAPILEQLPYFTNPYFYGKILNLPLFEKISKTQPPIFLYVIPKSLKIN